MNITLTETSAFEQFKPLADRIEAKMIERIRKVFALWAEQSGGTYKHYRYNDTSREAQDFRIVSRYVRKAEGELSMRTGTPVVLAEDFLAKEAKQMAEDSVMGFVAKLISKLGNIQMSNLHFHGGADFQIDATLNGHDIRVEQQTVFKYSKHNTLYCQFPARIYVDGKFTPASKFEDATK